MTHAATSQSRHWMIDAAGVAVLVALTAAAFSIIVQPLAIERDRAAVARSELADSLTRANDIDAAEAALRRELERVQKELDESPIQLEPADRLNHRLARIVDLATSADLAINETRSDRVAPGPRYDTVPLTLSGFGGYPDCVAFLRTLAETLPDVEVKSLSLSSAPATPGSQPMFSFDLAWYASAAGSSRGNP